MNLVDLECLIRFFHRGGHFGVNRTVLDYSMPGDQLHYKLL